MGNTFIAYVHLGKLARLLRLLGFDTAYKNSSTINELLAIGKEQERIVLSTNLSLARVQNIKTLIITSEDPMTQLKQAVDCLQLKSQFQPFSKCLVCNGDLQTRLKEEINLLLKENTSRYFNQFWQCNHCQRIYWKGSHCERMLKIIESAVVLAFPFLI